MKSNGKHKSFRVHNIRCLSITDHNVYKKIGPFWTNENTAGSEAIEDVPLGSFWTRSHHGAPVFGNGPNADLVGLDSEAC